MPAGSKTDLPLAKAEPISNGGSASGITYLTRGKNCCATAIAAGERSENMWEKQLCRHQGQWRRRGRRCSRQLQLVVWPPLLKSHNPHVHLRMKLLLLLLPSLLLLLPTEWDLRSSHQLRGWDQLISFCVKTLVNQLPRMTEKKSTLHYSSLQR